MRRIPAIGAVFFLMSALAEQPAIAEPLLRGSVEEDGAWLGTYGGVNFGFASGNAAFSALPNDEATLEGIVAGGHFGFNHRIERLAIGLEGDYDGASISYEESLHGVSASLSSNWLASIRGRLGVITDNYMLYATAGVAWADLELSASVLGITVSVADTMTGFVVGGGIEAKLGPKLSGRVEVLHYDFSDQDFEAAGTKIGYDADFTVIRTGVSYHVN